MRASSARRPRPALLSPSPPSASSYAAIPISRPTATTTCSPSPRPRGALTSTATGPSSCSWCGWPAAPRRRPPCNSGKRVSARAAAVQADAAARFGRQRHRRVGTLHGGEEGAQRLRDRGRPSLLEVDAQDEPFVGRRQIALGGVVHALNEVHALGIEIDQLGGDAQAVALLYLALVGDMHLGGEGGDARSPYGLAVDAHRQVEFVQSEVERLDVIGNIHVAVVVDPV